MKFLKKSLLAAAIAAAAGIGSTAHAGVVIDLFVDPAGEQAAATSTLGANDNNQAGPFALGNVIGAYRELSITKTGDTSGNVNLGESKVSVSGGVLQIDNAFGNKSRTVVTWDGVGIAGADGAAVTTTGLQTSPGVGVDLTAGGSTSQIFADILGADLGFDYKITVWDMDGSKSVLEAGVQFSVLSPVSSHYLFSWFNLPSGLYCDGVSAPPSCGDPTTQLDFKITHTGGAIDFQNIGALQLELFNVGVASIDLGIGAIQTVPEPGAIALVGVALLGAGAASRRRARKA